MRWFQWKQQQQQEDEEPSKLPQTPQTPQRHMHGGKGLDQGARDFLEDAGLDQYSDALGDLGYSSMKTVCSAKKTLRLVHRGS